MTTIGSPRPPSPHAKGRQENRRLRHPAHEAVAESIPPNGDEPGAHVHREAEGDQHSRRATGDHSDVDAQHGTPRAIASEHKQTSGAPRNDGAGSERGRHWSPLRWCLALSAARWPAGRPAAVLVAASLLATIIVFARYARQDYNYGTYKTLVSGGAFLAGTTAIALAAGWWSRAARFAGWIALTALAAVWLPGVVSLVHDVNRARSGFRAPDIAMGERLRELPDGSTVLVDGIGVDSGIGAFQMRMMAAYFVSTTPGTARRGALDHADLHLTRTATAVSSDGALGLRPERGPGARGDRTCARVERRCVPPRAGTRGGRGPLRDVLVRAGAGRQPALPVDDGALGAGGGQPGPGRERPGASQRAPRESGAANGHPHR